ncbi:MAG TPA: hypothetical protein VK829_06680 [Terriglobales bacterium]|jgi:hypothetical protein|nr:hypothetical protein [Terriglobales bacterium]
MRQAITRIDHRSKKSVVALGAMFILALSAFQFGDRNELNKMPYTDVQPLVSDLAKAKALAKQGNIDLLVGQVEPGETVRVRGEITDANCYLGRRVHAYDHAFCAKLCAAAGSPLVFIADQDGKVYLVLGEEDGVRLPENVLDRIGVPGILVEGKLLEASGIRAVAIRGLGQ